MQQRSQYYNIEFCILSLIQLLLNMILKIFERRKHACYVNKKTLILILVNIK